MKRAFLREIGKTRLSIRRKKVFREMFRIDLSRKTTNVVWELSGEVSYFFRRMIEKLSINHRKSRPQELSGCIEIFLLFGPKKCGTLSMNHR
jgi:hypothetical protein